MPAAHFSIHKFLLTAYRFSLILQPLSLHITGVVGDFCRRGARYFYRLSWISRCSSHFVRMLLRMLLLQLLWARPRTWVVSSKASLAYLMTKSLSNNMLTDLDTHIIHQPHDHLGKSAQSRVPACRLNSSSSPEPLKRFRC